jgi:ribonuclease G
LPWFRWKRKKYDPALPAQEAPLDRQEPDEAEPPAAQEAQTEATAADTAAAKRKRRRGSRGGRGRKKPTPALQQDGRDESAPSAKEAPAEKEPSRRQPEKRAEPSRRSTGRRRQPPRRAPLPEAKREVVISVDAGEQRVAVLEDGKVAEVYLERPERRSIAGNIYLGVVDNVLPGMEAAFVEIGLEKNGFLYVDEIVVPELEGKRHGKRIQDLISRGEQLLVQAVKDPMKTKGARLTTEISLPGRFLVYVPNGEGVGVSRRLEDAERQRLKEIIREIAPKTGGVIVRTAAEGASAEDVERDLVFLERLWKHIQGRAEGAKAPQLVYQEAELPLRIVRDLFAGDFVAATIDHERTYKRIVGYLKKTSPHMLERVHRYKDKAPLFELHGIDKEIESTLHRRVDLPSGGYLVFDYAEAFTVVDVNTGRFVGSRSKGSSSRLEDTITKNNLEAVTEVVRQLRLRDIGGIIVIDFIDMANPKNRELVEAALRTELERDRTKTYVVEISPLGLVEMTRQKVTEGPREILTRKCDVCHGDGILVSDQTVALEMERKLRNLAAGGPRVQAFKVALHPRVLALLVGPGGSRLAEIEEMARRRFYLVEAEGDHVHLDHFDVLEQGKREALAAQAGPEEGAKLNLKLLEVDRFDPTAAVGKAGDVDVVVAEGAPLVGKKAKVVVGRVLESAAYATRADLEDGAGPITFESEAEKPTRAPSGAKRKQEPAKPRAKVASATEAPKAEEVEGEPEVAELEPEPEVIDGEVEEAVKPRKKTRRGSRGGRRRRKPGVTTDEAADTDGDAASAGEGEPEAQPAEPKKPAPRRRPKIHVPEPVGEEVSGNGRGSVEAIAEDEAVADEAPPEDGATESGEQQKPRKKTRRGSRGGRGRKKKAAVASDAPDPEAAVEAVATAQVVKGYVPMSEWIDDIVS